MRVQALVLMMSLLGSTAMAEHNTLTEEEVQQGWQLLFDGESLDGWVDWNTKKPVGKGVWDVVDGSLAIVNPAGGSKHSIYTEAAYEHYEFQIEWKTSGNSGILLRVDPSYEDKIWHRAPEIQINKDDPLSLKSTSAGGVYGLYDFSEPKTFHPEGWNTSRIRCVEDHVVIWLNGKKTHEFTIGSDDWNERVANSKFRKLDHFAQLKKGHIGFQDHGKLVQFRNIKIRELNPDAP